MGTNQNANLRLEYRDDVTLSPRVDVRQHFYTAELVKIAPKIFQGGNLNTP
jgi:hypothetical protein